MMIEANNDDEVKGDKGESIQMVEVCDDDEARVLRSNQNYDDEIFIK